MESHAGVKSKTASEAIRRGGVRCGSAKKAASPLARVLPKQEPASRLVTLQPLSISHYSLAVTLYPPYFIHYLSPVTLYPVKILAFVFLPFLLFFLNIRKFPLSEAGVRVLDCIFLYWHITVLLALIHWTKS